MEHLREWMNACARFVDKPRNTVYASIDLFNAMEKHLDEALKDIDEVEDENERLREENAQLRRLLGLKEDAA